MECNMGNDRILYIYRFYVNKDGKGYVKIGFKKKKENVLYFLKLIFLMKLLYMYICVFE